MRKFSTNSRANAGIPVLVVGSSAKNGPSWLEGGAFAATPCLHAQDALKMLSSDRYEAVLCDLDMQGTGSKKLMNIVCEDFPDIAVVAVTSQQRKGIMAMIAGASGYIQTPIQPELVADSLQSALTRKRLDAAVCR